MMSTSTTIYIYIYIYGTTIWTPGSKWLFGTQTYPTAAQPSLHDGARHAHETVFPEQVFSFFFFFHSNSRGQFLFLAFFRCVFCHVLLVCFSLVFFDETTSQEPWFEHVAFLCFETQILYCD